MPQRRAHGNSGRNAGFALARALDSQLSIHSAGSASATIEQLTSGTWYFEIAAVNSADVHSQFSGAVSAVIK